MNKFQEDIKTFNRMVGTEKGIGLISFADFPDWIDKNFKETDKVKGTYAIIYGFILGYGFRKKPKTGKVRGFKDLRRLFVNGVRDDNYQTYVTFDNGCKIMLCHEGDVHIFKEAKQ